MSVSSLGVQVGARTSFLSRLALTPLAIFYRNRQQELAWEHLNYWNERITGGVNLYNVAGFIIDHKIGSDQFRSDVLSASTYGGYDDVIADPEFLPAFEHYVLTRLHPSFSFATRQVSLRRDTSAPFNIWSMDVALKRQAPKGVVLIAGGYQFRHSYYLDPLVPALVKAGFIVRLYDQPSQGFSDEDPLVVGDMSFLLGGAHVSSFELYEQAFAAEMNDLHQQYPGLPIGVIGHSMGGQVLAGYSLQPPEDAPGISARVYLSPNFETTKPVARWKVALSGTQGLNVLPFLNPDMTQEPGAFRAPANGGTYLRLVEHADKLRENIAARNQPDGQSYLLVHPEDDATTSHQASVDNLAQLHGPIDYDSGRVKRNLKEGGHHVFRDDTQGPRVADSIVGYLNRQMGGSASSSGSSSRSLDSQLEEFGFFGCETSSLSPEDRALLQEAIQMNDFLRVQDLMETFFPETGSQEAFAQPTDGLLVPVAPVVLPAAAQTGVATF